MYEGIVIDNYRPESEGMVQVFIPAIHPYPATSDDQKSEKKENPYAIKSPILTLLGGIDMATKSRGEHRYIGDDNLGDVTSDVILKLRKICPWVPVMGALAGGSSNIRYSESGKTTLSDVADHDDNFAIPSTYGSPHPESAKYTRRGSVRDAFSDPVGKFVRNGNINGLDYSVDAYPNAPKGLFSIPNIGASVYVQELTGGGFVIIGKRITNIDFDGIYNRGDTATPALKKK